jgi:hypothetical protein
MFSRENIFFIKFFQAVCTTSHPLLTDDILQYLNTFTDNAPYSSSEIDVESLERLIKEHSIEIKRPFVPIKSGTISLIFEGTLKTGQGQGQGQGQGMQINPQLQQQFMYVLQQNPSIRQQFADPKTLEQALQNSNVMMNTIAFHQQSLAQSASQPQTPQQQPQTEEDTTDEEDNEDGEKNQYDDKIDDIDIMNIKPSTIDRIVQMLKLPIILTLIYILLSQPVIKEYLITWIPYIANSTILQTLLLGVIFLSINVVLNIFIK